MGVGVEEERGGGGAAFVHEKMCDLLYVFMKVFHPLKTPKHELANSADPDQTPQSVASDQVLYCLQIVQPFFFRNIYII